MANAFNFSSYCALEGLRQLRNRLVVGEHFNTTHNREFKKEFAVGQTVTVPLPQWFNVTTGYGFQPQALDRPSTTVTIDRPKGVHFECPSPDPELFMERGKGQFRRQYLEPAMAALAQDIDLAAAEHAFYNTPNFVGILGTNPVSSVIMGQARQRLLELACPVEQDNLRFIIPPAAMRTIVDAEAVVFNPQSEISMQYKQGYKGKARGFDCFESMSLVRHTTGIWANVLGIAVGAAGQTGTNLAITCTAADSFTRGDRFNIAGVFDVNPKTFQSTGTLKQFVVMTAIPNATGTDTLDILPGIVAPGSHYQNVSALPGAGAVITMWPGSTIVNATARTGSVGLALHPDAFALCAAPLQVPSRSVEEADQTRDPDTGIPIAYVKDWDMILGRRMVYRFDTLFGFGNLYFDHCAVAVACA